MYYVLNQKYNVYITEHLDIIDDMEGMEGADCPGAGI